MKIDELPINVDYERMAEFCRNRGIRNLIGAVLRDDFDSKNL